MTRAQADTILAERGLVLVDVYAESDLSKPHHWLVTTASGGVISRGRTWQWAFADATDLAPF